jgi:hypothetical protein
MLPNQQATYPMLVKLSSGQLFEKSTFELSEAGKELLRSRIAELIDTASKTGSDTIEVIGHTDGQDYRLDRERAFFGGLAEREGGREYDPVRRKFVTKQPIGIVKLDAAAFDFDGTLHRYLEGTENALAPHGYQIQFQDRSSRLPKAPVWVLSNVELGMARAATVARYLKGQLPSGPIKTVRVYSAGQFLDSDGSPANSNATQDDFRRRRVELRLTRTQD